MKMISNKTKRMKEVESMIGEPIEEYLRRKFVDDNLSLQTISQELGIAYRILLQWLERAGVYSRKLI